MPVKAKARNFASLSRGARAVSLHTYILSYHCDYWDLPVCCSGHRPPSWRVLAVGRKGLEFESWRVCRWLGRLASSWMPWRRLGSRRPAMAVRRLAKNRQAGSAHGGGAGEIRRETLVTRSKFLGSCGQVAAMPVTHVVSRLSDTGTRSSIPGT